MKRPRILIADDHRIVAEALTKLVENEYEVVGIAGDGRRLVLAVKEFWPEVVIMDIAMPLLNGLDAADQLRLISPKTRVVILTMNHDLEIAGEALRRGAAGFLLKTSAGTELISALREVLRGNIYVTPRIAKGMQEQWAQNPNTEYKEADASSAGSIATTRRRADDERGCLQFEHCHPYRCVPQIQNHGRLQTSQQRGAGSTCHQGTYTSSSCAIRES